MALANLPEKRQPDAVPEHVTAHPPSLWLYGGLSLFALGLIVAAFKNRPDWPGLFLNLATELFGAVIILLLVERRLRASEVHAVRALPRRAGVLVILFFSPRRRQLYQYTRTFLQRLDELVADKLRRPEFDKLHAKLTRGFVLFAGPGYGKTTWLQIAAADLAREHLNAPTRSRVPILFPLRRWLPDRSLEDALFEHINSFRRVSRRAFQSSLKRGELIGLLDGADEVWARHSPGFGSQFSDLRAHYPKVPWTVSSRPNCPTPAPDLESVSMTPPTEDEIREIRQRVGI
jgi:NACHT domain